jgi:ADP-heptose:LPS heptosyltransferase
MTNLSLVTVVIIDTLHHAKAIAAIRQTHKHIKPARTVFLTDIDITVPNTEVIKIEPIKSKKEYSEFCIKELNNYFDTPFVLVIQHDGYVIDGDAWTDLFYGFDYIGAPWEYDERNVGNGGFSLRSKKLQSILANDDMISIVHPEDQSICILYRPYLEETYEIKFAPLELAERFSFETLEPICSTFGFHNMKALPLRHKPVVVVKRTAAMGDVIAVEPVLEYYHNKGYRVFIDTLDQFYWLFTRHKFSVEFAKYLHPRMPHILVDLDMAYEENPKQLHLKSYYEKAGIVDGEIRTPRLYPGTSLETKLFKKYAVLHLDRRPQGGRNVNGINWDYIAHNFLEVMGYTVIQVGDGESPDITGAHKMKAPSLNMLQWIISGADLFIGVDSGPSHIASAMGVPSVIFFGSVNPEFIHPEQGNKIYLHNHNYNVCEKPFCWHSEVTTVGVPCYINEEKPPCVEFTTTRVMDAIKEAIKKNG